MSAAPSEPEKYSIDEMMDRLKHSSTDSSDNGELVTRADGTQAVRVRKRKRRSSQPHKEDAERIRRARVIQVTAALVLVILAALVIGVGIIYANSPPFRTALVGKLQESSGATVEIQQFRMNPKTANANFLTLEWPQGNVLKNMSFRSINAEISPSSFLGKSMQGEEVNAAESKVALQFPTPGQPRLNHPAPGGSLPVNFARYRSRLLDFTLGSGPTAINLYKTEGSFTSSNIKGRPQLLVNKGELHIPYWPKLRLDRALLEFRGEETDIITLRLLHETSNSGSFEIAGTMFPYAPERATSLAVALQSFQLSGLLGPAFGHLISGEINTGKTATINTLTFHPTAEASGKLDITFTATPGTALTVQGFPFLSALSEALDDKWFLTPEFELQSAANLVREKGAATLQDISFESKSRMAMKGEVTLSVKNTLSGQLQVGLSEAVLHASKHTRLINMFGPATDGFCWITLQIGGQVSSPTDNFKALFDAAKTDGTSAAPVQGGGSSFDELTRPK